MGRVPDPKSHVQKERSGFGRAPNTHPEVTTGGEPGVSTQLSGFATYSANLFAIDSLRAKVEAKSAAMTMSLEVFYILFCFV